MHFRERGQIVQVIRTTYDKGSKKGKNEIVGRLAMPNPVISDDLQNALTAEERGEVESWIKGYGHVQALRRELAAHTLAENLRLAEEWFRGHKSDDARGVAAGVLEAWVHLRAVMKRNGLVA